MDKEVDAHQCIHCKKVLIGSISYMEHRSSTCTTRNLKNMKESSQVEESEALIGGITVKEEVEEKMCVETFSQFLDGDVTVPPPASPIAGHGYTDQSMKKSLNFCVKEETGLEGNVLESESNIQAIYIKEEISTEEEDIKKEKEKEKCLMPHKSSSILLGVEGMKRIYDDMCTPDDETGHHCHRYGKDQMSSQDQLDARCQVKLKKLPPAFKMKKQSSKKLTNRKIMKTSEKEVQSPHKKMHTKIGFNTKGSNGSPKTKSPRGRGRPRKSKINTGYVKNKGFRGRGKRMSYLNYDVELTRITRLQQWGIQSYIKSSDTEENQMEEDLEYTCQETSRDLSRRKKSSRDVSELDNKYAGQGSKSSALWLEKKWNELDVAGNQDKAMKKQCPQKLFCPVCDIYVSETYISLHFASLAHIHNELEYRQSRNDKVDIKLQEIVLEYFSIIIKRSPFLCENCKFYCNLHDDFVTHMKMHKNWSEKSNIKETFTCSVCPSKGSMGLLGVFIHLRSIHHLHSVKNALMDMQQVVFTGKIVEDQQQQQQQQEETSPRISNHPGYQCPKCGYSSSYRWQIEAHCKQIHFQSYGEDGSSNPTSTPNIQDASLKSYEKLPSQSLIQDTSPQYSTLEGQQYPPVSGICRMCYTEVEDLSALKVHMEVEHKKDCTPCHLCGHIFPLWVDLSHHQQQWEGCSGTPDGCTGKFQCDLCLFKNDMLAHVLMHKTLVHNQRQPDGRHVCHVCGTKLLTYSIKGHMLNHSNEWPHTCRFCSRKFRKEEWLKSHLLAAHPTKITPRENHHSITSTSSKARCNSRSIHDTGSLSLSPSPITSEVSQTLQELFKLHLIPDLREIPSELCPTQVNDNTTDSKAFVMQCLMTLDSNDNSTQPGTSRDAEAEEDIAIKEEDVEYLIENDTGNLQEEDVDDYMGDLVDDNKKIKEEGVEDLMENGTKTFVENTVEDEVRDLREGVENLKENKVRDVKEDKKDLKEGTKDLKVNGEDLQKKDTNHLMEDNVENLKEENGKDLM
ncbi:hypothetical protein Pcinc_005856 [Petrolisthes cinctipes]|uniref:C2H2-type domain-containing protein n=1 Tax=Petrolisthes cinctipes TaxID=88211 RepID=A0AAE1GIG1_PETCI|nr:hypothetical protein Pcinc_005856 [Petrolisthes cinctipes]